MNAGRFELEQVDMGANPSTQNYRPSPRPPRPFYGGRGGFSSMRGGPPAFKRPRFDYDSRPPFRGGGRGGKSP